MGIVTGPVRPGDGITPAVALVDPKFPHNVGAAVRAASCYGVRQVWFSGDRVRLDGAKRQRLPREERMRGYQDVEVRQADYFFDAFTGVDGDGGAVPVAVELRRNAESLIDFEHPDRALYVFGPEDGSLDRAILARCHRFLVIPTRHCTNLSAAVYTVLYDRHAKRVQAGLEPRNSVASGRGDSVISSPDDLGGPPGPRNPSSPDSPTNLSVFDEPDSMAPATGLTWPR
jgi:tRNA(Leu) C34 or U34 (ribose-2'-O)-methylase TrmL